MIINRKYLELLGLRGRLGDLRAQLILRDQPNLQHEYDLQLAQYKTKFEEFLQWNNFYSTHGSHDGSFPLVARCASSACSNLVLQGLHTYM